MRKYNIFNMQNQECLQYIFEISIKIPGMEYSNLGIYVIRFLLCMYRCFSNMLNLIFMNAVKLF